MAATASKTGTHRTSLTTGRRIVVVVVPPVDELDLVGPPQVFHSVNRLAGRPIYAIEVVTAADEPTVEGEGGVLTFLARNRFDKVRGECDTVLLGIAREFSDALNREVTYSDTPAADWERELKRAGLADYLTHHVVTMGALHRAGRYDRLTEDVQRVTGRAAMSVREFVSLHADEFGGGPAPATDAGRGAYGRDSGDTSDKR